MYIELLNGGCYDIKVIILTQYDKIEKDIKLK